MTDTNAMRPGLAPGQRAQIVGNRVTVPIVRHGAPDAFHATLDAFTVRLLERDRGRDDGPATRALLAQITEQAAWALGREQRAFDRDVALTMANGC